MPDGDRIPKVLGVDDEPNIRELVEVALKFHGCAVAVSASGKDALHQAGAYEPDLMILDVMLPDMDGFEVCRTLRSEGNDVPVIFLTARDTTSDTIRGLTLAPTATAQPWNFSATSTSSRMFGSSSTTSTLGIRSPSDMVSHVSLCRIVAHGSSEHDAARPGRARRSMRRCVLF